MNCQFFSPSPYSNSSFHSGDYAHGRNDARAGCVHCQLFRHAVPGDVMQTISSTTMAVITAIDLFHSIVSLLSLHKRSQEIAANIRLVFGAEIPVTESFNLLTSIRSLCSQPQLISTQLRPGIRVQASVPHQLPAGARGLLERLEKHSVCNSDKGNFTKSTPLEPKVDNVRAKRVLCRSLEVLFTSECLVLAEYVEFVVPLLYAAFVWTMGHLPSARYHSEMEGVTADNVGTAVTGILAYALLELTSFVALAISTKRSCGIRTLYQLAFVLETQWSLIVSKVILWMLFTLTFRVVHFGADFSFRFQWIHPTM